MNSTRLNMLFLFLPEWPFPVGHPCRLLSLQGSDSGSEVVSLQLLPSFISPASAEAETSGRPAPLHAGRGWPSPGRPVAVSLRASVPAQRGDEPRGAGGPLAPPQALLQQRNGKLWAQKRELEIQTSEVGENSRGCSQGSSDVCGWYVF